MCKAGEDGRYASSSDGYNYRYKYKYKYKYKHKYKYKYKYNGRTSSRSGEQPKHSVPAV